MPIFVGGCGDGSSVADLQRACRPYDLVVSASGQIQRIASVLVLARTDKRTLFCEVHEIAGCCGGRSAGDCAGLGRADDNARAKEKLLFRSGHPETVPRNSADPSFASSMP